MKNIIGRIDDKLLPYKKKSTNFGLTASYILNKKSVPRFLTIELLNTCNANCTFCAKRYDERKHITIDDDIFYKAVNEYKEIGGTKISLTPWVGEACLYKKLLEKIRYVHNLGFESIDLNTNGLLIHKVGIKELLNAGLTYLAVSTAPLIKDTYLKIYRNRHYEQLLKNLRDLLILFENQKKERTVKSLHIEFRSDRPIKECLKTKDYLEYVAPYISEGVDIGGYDTYTSWNGAITKEDLSDGMHLITKSNKSWGLPCTRSHDIQITVNGDIRLCGCSFNPISDDSKDYEDLLVGNIRDTGLIESYNSKKAREVKASFITGNAPEGCQKCIWRE
jgi:sulfatase maturation enzyme AslB (radical SAM superfamily)